MVTAMRAARLHEIGGTLHVDEIDDPVPADGEVVVDIDYASVNPLDIWVTRGAPGVAAANLPWIPGTEGAGHLDGRRRAGARRWARRDAPRSLPRAGRGAARCDPRSPRRPRSGTDRRDARRRRHRAGTRCTPARRSPPTTACWCSGPAAASGRSPSSWRLRRARRCGVRPATPPTWRRSPRTARPRCW